MKNKIATNILTLCSQDMQSIYFLLGWKDSTQHIRMLYALNRRNGFQVLMVIYLTKIIFSF